MIVPYKGKGILPSKILVFSFAVFLFHKAIIWTTIFIVIGFMWYFTSVDFLQISSHLTIWLIWLESLESEKMCDY